MVLKNSAELMELLAGFAKSYPWSPEGISHRKAYREQQKLGRRHFEEIVAASQSGQEVAPASVMQLLPALLPEPLSYGGSAGSGKNRQQPSWISIDPGISENIIGWLKNSGWLNRQNWPQIARAILGFLRQCNDDPSQLPGACAQVLQLPYFQDCPAGMLAPILNALHPDRFLLLNHKSRSVINYFSKKNYSSELADYPPANASGQIIMSAIAQAIQEFSAPALADCELFELFCHWLVSLKKYNLSQELPEETKGKNYWQISPGENAKDWEAWRDGNFIALRWDAIGDISGVTRREFEALCVPVGEPGATPIASLRENSVGEPGATPIAPARENRPLGQQPEWRGNKAENNLWQFANDIKQGDRVVPNRGQTEVLGIGTVTGSYYFVPNVLNRHRLPVRWDELTPRQVNEKGWDKTLMKLEREKFELICNAPSLLAAPKTEAKQTKQQNPNYSLTELATETGFELATLARWVRGIERKKQAILYGPPGTGKTFIAERLARHLIGGGTGFWELVQFHPGYAYEDFIQGIRPKARPDGKLDYPLVPGRFLEFCAKARESLPHFCVLIIDEINRANLSSVFGELFYLLEYRDKEVALAGGSEGFSIPANVRIIGTMNTADKSIALVDNALRRRFAFLELLPNYDILRRYHKREQTGFAVEGLIAALQAVNRRIGDRNYELGISFFLLPDLADQIEDIWRMEIEPYLEEYFFGNSKVVDEVRWDKIGKTILK